MTQSPPLKIVDILGPATPTIRVCAVGAMHLRGLDEPHDTLMAQKLCTVVGFEPVQTECDKLNTMYGPVHRYLPHVIGDGSRRTFHRMNYSMTSSIYPPNTSLLRKFQTLDEVTQIVATEEVQTLRLDDLPEIGDVDFLKIDVQGATYDVLVGAEKLLRGVAVVHAEVEFVPLYLGERLFGDVDPWLRDHGFAFHKFAHIMGKSLRPLLQSTPEGHFGQQLWADVIYAKDFMRLGDAAPRQLLALAVIMHEVYQSYDLCSYALHVHDKVAGSQFWPTYIERLTGVRTERRLEE